MESSFLEHFQSRTGQLLAALSSQTDLSKNSSNVGTYCGGELLAAPSSHTDLPRNCSNVGTYCGVGWKGGDCYLGLQIIGLTQRCFHKKYPLEIIIIT